MEKEKRDLLERDVIAAYRNWDNLDTALIELKSANHTIREYVEDEDTKEDYFTSISRTQLVLEEVAWVASAM